MFLTGLVAMSTANLGDPFDDLIRLFENLYPVCTIFDAAPVYLGNSLAISTSVVPLVGFFAAVCGIISSLEDR
jgi:hypothetical protein